MTNDQKTKSYEIPKREVFEAWKRVKSNKGSAGVDGISIEQFEMNLSKNLYKVWNRMSSGSYFPGAVKRVEIPKVDGSMRPLGIPNVCDRIAQDVVRARLEVELEPIFHNDSYGFRPNKSAHDAIAKCKSRCQKYNWVIDLDISKYFDTIDHELLMKAVRKHCQTSWMIMYIERWLKAPVLLTTGETINNNTGTPQGGVISPLLANLFLHYVFDRWISKHHPKVLFERYADDLIIHCETETEARQIFEQIQQRFSECNLKVHPEKTKLVYCRDYRRQDKNHKIIKFDFLGVTFRPRCATSKINGKAVVRFWPSASKKSKKRVRDKIKAIINSKHTSVTVEILASKVNPIIKGWLNYFARYYGVGDIIFYIQKRLTNWLMRKRQYNTRRAIQWLVRCRKNCKTLLAHWSYN
ncbi:MAG: group II intron reverse transcriptase/maturase [Proteobacteria bacterium]|nr:group II intron reverse transcriptase/maturase [Pseudomonadota bacterium]